MMVVQEIEAMRSSFIYAYSGMSFSPELRADACVNDFSAELADDLEKLGDKAGDYKAKYLGWVRTWAGRKARCMSTMITGGSNFPVESNRKKMNAEHRTWEDFRKWRSRYFKAVTREKTKSPEEEIDDAIIELERCRNAQTQMIGINKIIRGKGTIQEKAVAAAKEYHLTEKAIHELFSPSYSGSIGVAQFELTNNRAKMKRLEEKILTMKNRINAKDEFQSITFDGGSVDIEDDRVVIRHETKPGTDVIAALKGKGFHWSPKNGYWCRKHTANAIAAAKQIIGATI
jgi:hypothetical protein